MIPILVDTSVWIDHFRSSEPRLVEILNRGEVLGHAFVIGELACGSLGNRQEILGLLHNLPSAPRASDKEVLLLIENCALMGRGIGYIDAHLLASILLAGNAKLWTRDRRLLRIANEMSLGFERQ